MRIRVGLVSWRALYARRANNAAHGVSRGCAAGTSLSAIEANEELTYVGIENPGPGVSTWTRAGCSNESANERGGNRHPAGPGIPVSGSLTLLSVRCLGFGGAVRFDLEQRSY